MRTWLLLASCALAGAVQAQAIYRCDDGAGGVLYADSPCPRGRVVDIAAGAPDPRARERLDRELAAFEQRQAARVAALQRERERIDEARRRDSERLRADREYAQPAPLAYYTPLYTAPIERPFRPRPMRVPKRPAAYLPVR